jgi:hypothetical protein
VAGIVLVTVSSYVPLTVCITERRGKVGWYGERLLMSAVPESLVTGKAGIVLITVSSYTPLTVCITERRGKVGF